MRYYTIDPDVPGFLMEPRQVLKNNPNLSEIHYVFECWPNDDIVQAYPVILVSDCLANRIKTSNLTGYELKKCVSSRGDQFDIVSPKSGPLPVFHWLNIVGVAGVDDFGINDELILVISEEVRHLLDDFRTDGSDFEQA